MKSYYNKLDTREIIKDALKEDIATKDITTNAFVPKYKYINGIILAKQDCVVCGLAIASCVFKMLDKNIKFKDLTKEGTLVKKGKVIARISGKARSILTAERVALNFLSLLCGISTKTRKFVEAVKPFKAKIIDTRKTLPGLRVLEKYAVRIGGGFNHRMSLDEMIMIKDNHLQVLGSKFWAQGLEKRLRGIKTEIEVKTLKEFNKALRLRPDIIMLDNMSISDMNKAVKIRNNLKPKLEASGGITLKNVKQIASTGVDMISVGALTHSVNSIDISLEIL
jgi:nicotinate-nucleotide pyrophosphorylase (carboxylating)